jgi:hypothetical protein
MSLIIIFISSALLMSGVATSRIRFAATKMREFGSSVNRGSSFSFSFDTLEVSKEKENEDPLFTELPNSRIFVAANLILDVATPDISKADEIKIIIKDIWDIRQSKLRKIVDSFVQSGSMRATLDHVQLIELNSIRPLLPQTLDHIHRLEMNGSELRNRSQTSQLQNNTTADRSLLSNTILY